MTVTQIYELMNGVTDEILGESVVVKEDLSNVVDIGTAIFNASAVDNYVKTLVNHIGRVIFVNRPYSGSVPSVLMDGWEFGSILEKISVDLPEAEENESWSLTDKTSYDPNIFYQPKVSAKFFNKRTTFNIPASFTERQVKESFSSVAQLNGFISMIYNAVDKSMTVKIDSLVMRTINNMIGETINADYGADSLSSKSGIKAVNLLYLYNERYDKELTASDAMTDPDFIRFASFEMGVYVSRLAKISTLFNIGGKDRFTPGDLLHFVLLADFKRSADVYLQSDVFHDQFTELPSAETVPYWQGSGTDYGFNSITSINITTASGVDINASGILGVMFDRDALGMASILEESALSPYNVKGRYWNNAYNNKFKTRFDMTEKAVLLLLD